MADTGNETSNMLAIDRAESEFRRGQGVLLIKEDKPFAFIFPAEFLDADFWENIRHHQGQLLDVKGKRDISGKTIEELAELCYGDGLGVEIKPLDVIGNALVKLAKQAGILPVLISLPAAVAPPTTQSLDWNILEAPLTPEVIQGDTAQLPIKGAAQSTLTSFRTRYGSSVHLALCIGDWDKVESPLVRMHSSCVTGDILGSLRCDCGDQLHLALDRIKQEGAGILLYLHQEGRGIGIHSKLRTYRLQEQGLDTYAANTQLGYEEDERDFSIAQAMLKALGVEHIKLLTNNPDKIAALESAGITIAQRVPLITQAGEHNQHYLTAKAKKHGHLY